MDTENGAGLVKNRKLGLRKIDEMEETPFTGSYKPTVKSQSATLESQKNPNCLRNTRCYFCEFCDNTSIHGLKFLGERGRYVIEKVWWFLVVFGAISCSALLITKTYDKWVTSPVVVTFAMTETPIWKVPFPAVTICPELKINRTIFNLTDVHLKYKADKNVTKEEEEFYKLFSLVCESFSIDDNETNFISDDTLDNFLGAFFNLSPDDCKWLGQDYDCEDVLSYTITNEGWCRTFNMLDAEEIYTNVEDYIENRTIKNTKPQMWSLENGYPDGAGLNAYPRRTILSGSKAGFEMTLSVDDDDLDYLCTELQGFKVTLHHPAEEPDMDKHFRVPLNQAVVVGIRPRMITTANELRDYRPEERQCYIPNEKTLSTYKIYSQQNCIAECLTNYTLENCGCISFSSSYNGDAEICGPGSKACVEEAKVQFLANDVISKIKKDEEGDISSHCDCSPACTSLEFDSETSQTDWEWRKSLSHSINIPEYDFVWNTYHRSKIIVYYKEMQFMTSERHELYGTIDFLANCGGLLGLFCGFSFTSLMEILYYLTLRFFCNLKKFGRRVWSGASELIEEEDN